MQVHGYVYINDEPCAVTNMFDACSKETKDIEKAVSVVVLFEDGQWGAMDIEPVEIHKVN